MADNKFKNLNVEPVDPPNGELFVSGSKVDSVQQTLAAKDNKIYTYGNVDSRRTPTRNKNVKIRESIYHFIDLNTDGDQNTTLILNHILELGVAQLQAKLVNDDVDIKGN